MLKMLVHSAVFLLIFIGVNTEIEYPEEEYCPAVKMCRTPLLYDVKYRCASDKSCRPQRYKCCRSDCYIHKVCVVPVNKNGEKIQLPDDILEASTYVITDPTEEFTTAQHNITENFFSTINTDEGGTGDLTDPTDTTEPNITGTEFTSEVQPRESSTEMLIPTGKEWPFEGSGEFGDEKDKVSSTTTFLTTDDIDGSGNDEDYFVFPDDDRIKNLTSATNNDFSFDNSGTVRDVDVVEGSGSGFGDSDDHDVDEGVKIEKMWEGSGLDPSIDNEPDDVDEMLTTYIPQINDLNYNTTSTTINDLDYSNGSTSEVLNLTLTSKVYENSTSITVIETHQNTTVTEFIDIDNSGGSTLEELNLKNATFISEENTTLQGLLNVSTSNAPTEEHQTETVAVEVINPTTTTYLTEKDVLETTNATETVLIYSTEKTTEIPLSTSLSNAIVSTSRNETNVEHRNYSTNEIESENLGTTISVSAENSNSSTIGAEVITTTKPRTTEIVEEGSGNEFPDSEPDDVDEEITTYVPILLNRHDIRIKPNLTFTLAPDDGSGVTLVEDDDGDYDDNEVDEDIRNNFQTRITSG